MSLKFKITFHVFGRLVYFSEYEGFYMSISDTIEEVRRKLLQLIIL